MLQVEVKAGKVLVIGLRELSAVNSDAVRERVRQRISPTANTVEFDMSETVFIDRSGLGALMAVHETTRAYEGNLRLVNPNPQVAELLELTRMHRLIELVMRP